MIAIIGRSDRPCWLAEAGKILLLLQSKLGCHGFPVAAGRFAGAAHLDRAHWVCLFCNSGAVGMRGTWSLNVLPLSFCDLSMQDCSRALMTP